MIGLLGSGFGLYGHLPALVELGQCIYIPRRYRSVLDQRTELQQYCTSVHFVDDESKLTTAADLLILAQRPNDNKINAEQVAHDNRHIQLVIEKPLASTPLEAINLDHLLREAGIRHATPYLFVYCDWAQVCECEISAGRGLDIQLNWCFNSHHSSSSWKSVPKEGGGTLNFYFIHVIALVCFLYKSLRPLECSVYIDDYRGNVGITARHGQHMFTANFSPSTSDASFTLTVDNKVLVSALTPFGDIPRRGVRDPRIDILKRFYVTEVFNQQHDTSTGDWRHDTLLRWKDMMR
jgi:predicted dehydrogenase